MKSIPIEVITRRNSRNVLRAHSDGTFSYRIAGRWTRRVRELSQVAYLALLRIDRERIVLAEYNRGRSLVTGTRCIVARGKETV
jgi:hypothetical protein